MYYNQASVKQVDVPSTSGTFGILAQHVPLLAALKPGVITVTEDDGTINKYFASSGTVTVNADSSVQVLSEIAVPLDYLDPDATQDYGRVLEHKHTRRQPNSVKNISMVNHFTEFRRNDCVGIGKMPHRFTYYTTVNQFKDKKCGSEESQVKCCMD
ncbi:putative ATP synthase subunit delta, mitochondrial [Apostichopus japonicus]|uniref:Putative ATP synthase subunit delta, mitochondrial n=1 Tax=Stichopus japonicus TaxID=307972 RepID=A0A2G8L693_STIJA|nr:putative ATP synthase subunit delta, mitochondrial [Apostichopus japonicus]